MTNIRKSQPERSLVKMLEQQIVETDMTMSQTGEQRERNHRNFSLQPMGNEIKGRSQYIAPKVLDAVESKKAYMTQVFFSGREPLEFISCGQEDEAVTKRKGEYVKRQLEKNKWHRIAQDGWHDAMVAKRMVLHVEWKNDTGTSLVNVDGATPEQLQFQLQSIEDALDYDYSGLQADDQGILHGEVRVTTDESKANIKLVQPERYFRDQMADYPDTSMWCSYEEDEARGMLVEQGFDEEQVDKLDQDYRFRRQEEDNARRAHDGSWTRTKKTNREPDQQLVTTYHTYTWLDMSKHEPEYPEGMRLWKIRWAHGEVLRWADGTLAIEEVSEMPFFEWCQIKISHSDTSLCDADLEADAQRATSTMTRLALDNQQARNMGKREILEKSIVNMRELLSPKISGNVRVREMGSVAPIPVQDLSSAFGVVMETLATGSEERTGLSRLSKGMNKDAVSEQNSADMIARLTNASNRRVMAECRSFANYFGELCKYIYVLGVRNDKRVYQLEADGESDTVSPVDWAEPAPSYKVRTALTPEESATMLMGLQAAHQAMSADPHLSQLYGVEQRHALITDFMEAGGISGAGRYMITPNSDEHRQLQEIMNEQQARQEAAMAEQQRIQQQMMASMDQREWLRARVEQSKAMVDATDRATDNMRADSEVEANIRQGDRKLDIEEKKAGAA